MAAQTKMGLDYFPRDTGLINDRKFIKVKKEYGIVGILVYERLLELIYSDKGYYIEYTKNRQEEVLWDLGIACMGKDAPSEDTIKGIIEMLVERELFDKGLFEIGILTSKRIQKTYYQCTIGRKNGAVERALWLLDIDEMEELSVKSAILDYLRNNDEERKSEELSGVNADKRENLSDINADKKEVLSGVNADKKEVLSSINADERGVLSDIDAHKRVVSDIIGESKKELLKNTAENKGGGLSCAKLFEGKARSDNDGNKANSNEQLSLLGKTAERGNIYDINSGRAISGFNSAGFGQADKYTLDIDGIMKEAVEREMDMKRVYKFIVEATMHKNKRDIPTELAELFNDKNIINRFYHINTNNISNAI